MDYSHDVIVIGAGAAGLTAAGGCAMFGLKVALIEAGEMGGECLNTGCVPSKALLSAAARAGEARVKERLGVALSAPKIRWAGVHGHVHDAIARIAPHDSQERFEGMGCEVIRGSARVTDQHSVYVAGRTIRAPRLVIATGSDPLVPPIDGIDSVPYLTNETLWDLKQLPGHLAIIGGGAVGMEMGQAFRRLGSEVTIVNDGPLLPRDDPESVAVLVEAMKAEGVRFIDAKAARVEGMDGAIKLQVAGGGTLAATHLLVAAGRKARCTGYGLREIGVEMGANGVKVDARRRTSFKHIYAIGDCREGPRLTHVAGYEGSNVALEIATGLPTKVDWRALPWCTYTDPQVAQVGLTEAQAREKHGDAITVLREPFAENDRAVAEGDRRGHVKLVMKGRKLLGASVVGAHAGDMLLPLAQVITGKASTFALGSAVIAYPTRGEIAKALAFKAWEPLVFGEWPKKWCAFIARRRRGN